ncbi:MAG: hypothetical protein L0Z62_35625 [Gemmataceae bacterium]|nr:hypothetical protein [Gemmataceae bacterium]
MLTITCPTCGQNCQIPDGCEGQQVTCPTCAHPFLIPAPFQPRVIRSASGYRRKGIPSVVWWGVAGLVIMILALIGNESTKNPRPPLQLVVGSWLLIGLIALVHYCRPACPSCGRRWSVSKEWLHANVDRSPDRRYSDNPRICSGCCHVYGVLSR